MQPMISHDIIIQKVSLASTRNNITLPNRYTKDSIAEDKGLNQIFLGDRSPNLYFHGKSLHSNRGVGARDYLSRCIWRDIVMSGSGPGVVIPKPSVYCLGSLPADPRSLILVQSPPRERARNKLNTRSEADSWRTVSKSEIKLNLASNLDYRAN